MPKGLYKRGRIWHIDKYIKGYGRLAESTGEESEEDAVDYLAMRKNAIKEAVVYGRVSRITFDQAAALYVEKYDPKKKSLKNDINDLKKAMPYIGHLWLDQIHNDHPDFQRFVKDQKEHGGSKGKGAKDSTVNRSITIVGRVLNLAAKKWRNEHNQPYLKESPILERLGEEDKKITQPIDFSEEAILLKHLNEEHQDYWTFATMTGLRDQSQAKLRWEWEVDLSQIGGTGFVIPRKYLKNGDKLKTDWLLILNSCASAIIEKYRGKNPDIVFPTRAGVARYRMRGTHFKKAVSECGLDHIDWHSARATFASRLRVAGISHEDRQYLMAHSVSSITTQYSWGAFAHLRSCVELLCDSEAVDPMVTVFNINNLKKVK